VSIIFPIMPAPEKEEEEPFDEQGHKKNFRKNCLHGESFKYHMADDGKHKEASQDLLVCTSLKLYAKRHKKPCQKQNSKCTKVTRLEIAMVFLLWYPTHT
jgi:hypothetical protein